MNKYKVGDIVILVEPYSWSLDHKYRQVKIETVSSDGFTITVILPDGNHEAMRSSRVVPIDVYDSPLYKALKECQ